jgi:hypothetical protein
MSEPREDLSDEALSRRLRSELRRYAAPASLRQALEAAACPPRPGWLAPVLAAAATALLLLLGLVPLLPRERPPDPLGALTRAVVSEHLRAHLWGARRADAVGAALPWVARETGIELIRVFAGDEQLALVGIEPVYLDRRRGVALHYRDREGHHLTYVVLPAPDLGLPERHRMTVDRFRPALLEDDGIAIWVWKHGELACFLASEMPAKTHLDRFKDYFVRVRAATEPVALR